MRARWCRVGAALFVASCVSAVDDDLEVSGQAQPLVIADDAQPAREVSANADDPPPHGVHHLALPGGRILRGGRLLRVIDVRKPEHPRVEGVLEDYSVWDGVIYPLGDHALVQGGSEHLYTGERDDVPIPRERSGGILNVDYSVRSKPRVVNRVQLSYPIALGQGQAGSALYGIRYRNQLAEVYLSRYELQGERLVLTGELRLEGPVEKLEPFGSRLAMEFQTENPPARIAVVDGSGADLQLLYQTSAPNPDPEIKALAIDGPKLRVAFADGVPWPAIDTFDLTKDATQGRLARCDVTPPPDPWNSSSWMSAAFYSKNDHSFFLSDGGESVTYQVPFNASGQCPLQRVIHHREMMAFHTPAAQRLLAADSSNLNMFTTRQSASQPLVASEPLAGIWTWSDSTRPIRVFELDRPVFAPNGTREHWLVGLSYYAEFDGPVEGTFQVFTASRDTLTPRSSVYEYQYNGDIELYGRTLVTMSAAGLRTFDLRNLEAPKRLGTLDLEVGFDPAFRFSNHVLRIRTLQLAGPSEGFDSREEVLLERLDSIGASPVATWPFRWDRVHIKADDLLLEASWNRSSQSEYLSIQILDLSEPSRPRNAGVFVTDEIRPDTGYDALQFPYRAVGRSLLIAQRTEPGGPYSSLRVIDFSNPVFPQLGDETVTFPGRDFAELRSSVGVGTTLYHSDQRQDGWYGMQIIVDGHYPSVSDEVRIPSKLVAATPDGVAFTASSSSALELSVSRVDFRDREPMVSTTRVWPGRELSSIRCSDDGRYVYLTHRPHWQAPPGDEPRSDWAHLEVLSAQTLETVGTLELDVTGRIVESAKGRLFIAIKDALLFVDVRDPAQPTARAAVPFTFYEAVAVHDNKVYVATPRVRSYPIDLRNLTN